MEGPSLTADCTLGSLTHRAQGNRGGSYPPVNTNLGLAHLGCPTKPLGPDAAALAQIPCGCLAYYPEARVCPAPLEAAAQISGPVAGRSTRITLHSSPLLPGQTRPQATCLASPGAKGAHLTTAELRAAGGARHSRLCFLLLVPGMSGRLRALPVLNSVRDPHYRACWGLPQGHQPSSQLEFRGALPRSHSNSRLLQAGKAPGRAPPTPKPQLPALSSRRLVPQCLVPLSKT